MQYWLWEWTAPGVWESKGEIVPEKWRDSEETAVGISTKSRVLTSQFSSTKFSQFSPTGEVVLRKR